MKDDRGNLDLTKRIDDLEDIIKGYQKLTEENRKEIYKYKEKLSEFEKNENLLHGYKLVIEDLSKKINNVR